MNSMQTIIVAIISSNALFTFITYILSSKSHTDKILKCLLKNALYQTIDRAKAKGYKTHLEDCDFNYMMELYKKKGNGNSQSMYKEWDSIPIKED